MSLTFLIGNGFDIQNGLDTSYESFYRYLEEMANKENSLTRNSIYQSIKEKREKVIDYNDKRSFQINEDLLWADLELGIGEYSKKKNVDIEKYADDKEEIEQYLVLFLKKEENKIVFDEKDQKINKLMLDDISNVMQKLLRPEQRDQLMKNTDIQKGQTLQVNFIDFNYTDVLKRAYRMDGYAIGARFASVRNITLKDGEFLKIHGDLNSEVFNLGVDNIAQLDSSFENHVELPFFIKSLNSSQIEQAYRYPKGKDIISSSKLYVTFGLSLGETDATWWKLIFEKICEFPNRAIVICLYKENLTPRKERLYCLNEKEKLIEKYAPSKEHAIKELLEERIFVVINKPLFDIKDYIKRNEDEKEKEIFLEAENQSIDQELIKNNQIQTLNEPIVKNLSKEAKSLLLKAFRSEDGKISVLQKLVDKSKYISINGETVSELENGRERTYWASALEELNKKHGLIEAKNKNLNEFYVTKQGYEVADILEVSN